VEERASRRRDPPPLRYPTSKQLQMHHSIDPGDPNLTLDIVKIPTEYPSVLYWSPSHRSPIHLVLRYQAGEGRESHLDTF
jgi:hypothetical protein